MSRLFPVENDDADQANVVESDEVKCYSIGHIVTFYLGGEAGFACLTLPGLSITGSALTRFSCFTIRVRNVHGRQCDTPPASINRNEV
jgi:hypothetical protein